MAPDPEAARPLSAALAAKPEMTLEPPVAQLAADGEPAR